MKLKKILPAVLAIFILFFGAMRTFAATRKFLENCYVNEQDNTFVIISSPTISTNGSPSADRLDITLSGEKLSVKSIAGSGRAGIPATYCCLVDVSGSMNSEQMAQAKSALLSIVDGMNAHDNMAIATLGNTLSQYDFTGDKEKLREIINSLTPISTEDTNLYAGIVSSISTLKTNGSVNLKRSLVILSDGMDDMVSGYTREEAVRAISNSGVPVYTVATLRGSNQAESGKLLGELARLSTGGNHYAPVIDGISGSDAGHNIVASVNSGYIITTDISDLDTGLKDEILLLVRATMVDGSMIEDSMTIYTEDLPRVSLESPESSESPEAYEPPETPSEPTTSDDEPENVPTSQIKDPRISSKGLIAIVIAAIALIAIVAIAIFAILKKKKKDQESDGDEAHIDEQVSLYSDKTESITNNSAGYSEIKKSVSGITIKFTIIGGVKSSTETTVSFYLPENSEKTIGRDNRADFILNSTDRNLSGVNSKLLYSKGRLYLSDAGSKNGTVHNGIPLHVKRAAVEKDDKIRVGSYEYRIRW